MAAQNSRGNSRGTRIIGRPFPKGKSANPGGRPKVAAGFADWCRAQFETPAGRTFLRNRMKKSDYVLTKLLGYAYGQPKQTLDVNIVRSELGVTYPDGRKEELRFEPQTSSVH